MLGFTDRALVMKVCKLLIVLYPKNISNETLTWQATPYPFGSWKKLPVAVADEKTHIIESELQQDHIRRIVLQDVLNQAFVDGQSSSPDGKMDVLAVASEGSVFGSSVSSVQVVSRRGGRDRRLSRAII